MCVTQRGVLESDSREVCLDSSRRSSACFQLGSVLYSAVIEAGAVGPLSLMMGWVWAASASLCLRGLGATLESCAIVVPIV